MGFGIDRVAGSRKPKGGIRALFGKAPGAQEVGDRLMRLTKRMFRGAIIDASPRRITFELHPAASPVRIVILPDGKLEVAGETSGVGPGYHTNVLARLAPILDELDYVWADPDVDPQAATCAWLAAQLVGDGPHRIGMPSDRSFVIDAPVLTAMGPRTAAWRDAVRADPRRGSDAFAWWDSAPGHGERSRALLAMWHEVPWRPPLDKDERTTMERVDADLRAAHAADPNLALPWAEWAELLEILDVDDAVAATVRARAVGTPTIGYRRFDIDAELSGGWSIRLPAAFLGGWEDDEERYVATDGVRSIEFTSLTADGEHDSDRLLEVAPERHPVIERLAAGALRGRAEGHDEDGVSVVHGLMTCAPDVAIVTCKGDRAWALATWRSLSRG